MKHAEALEAVERILGEKTENNPFGSYTDKPDYDKIYNENLRAQKQRKRLTGHEGTS